MSNIAYELFASRLKESMNQQQMKPIDLLHLAEEQNLKLGKSHISQYVNGKTMPRAEILQFLADALQVDADWLAGRTGSAQDFSSEKLNSRQYEAFERVQFLPSSRHGQRFLRRRFGSIFCILQTFRFGSEEIFFPSGWFRLFRSVCFPADAV